MLLGYPRLVTQVCMSHPGLVTQVQGYTTGLIIAQIFLVRVTYPGAWVTPSGLKWVTPFGASLALRKSDIYSFLVNHREFKKDKNRFLLRAIRGIPTKIIVSGVRVPLSLCMRHS